MSQFLYQPTWESLDQRPIPAWFQQAKFGIFVHWGVYSVPAWRPLSDKLYASYAEWYYARVIGDQERGGDAFHKANYGENFEYRNFAPQFRAELFNPDAWAELFKRAGARYVVLTSKHHDGFCLWPTKSPFKKEWNSGTIGPKRDLVGELTQAVRSKGLKMGLYYSIVEWESNPTVRTPSRYWLAQNLIKKYGIPLNRYVYDHLLPQLKELVENYQPALLFADGGEWDESAEYWQTKEFLAWLYNQAPNCDEVVVNDRWCKGMPGQHGDYFSSEYQDAKVEQGHPWEESRGVGGSYGFNRAENLDDYRTSDDLIRELIKVVSGGGNFLLNVGPTADGRIPVIQQQRLADIGVWLQINGEGIYGSQRLEGFTAQTKVPAFFTRKGNSIYVFCQKWPGREFSISTPKNSFIIENISLLGAQIKVQWEAKPNEWIIRPDCGDPDILPTSAAYVFRVQLSKAQ